MCHTHLLGPKTASGIEERGELANGPTVASGDHKDVAVKVGELVGSDYRMVGLRWGVHLGKDFVAERLGTVQGEKSWSERSAPFAKMFTTLTPGRSLRRHHQP